MTTNSKALIWHKLVKGLPVYEAQGTQFTYRTALGEGGMWLLQLWETGSPESYQISFRRVQFTEHKRQAQAIAQAHELSDHRGRTSRLTEAVRSVEAADALPG